MDVYLSGNSSFVTKEELNVIVEELRSEISSGVTNEIDKFKVEYGTNSNANDLVIVNNFIAIVLSLLLILNLWKMCNNNH